VTTRHLLDNIVTATWNSDTYASPTSAGMFFQVEQSCWLTRLGWYRHNTDATYAVRKIRCMDQATGATVASLAVTPDSGSVGWQWTTLEAPQLLQPYHQYTIQYLSSATGNHGANLAAANVSPPSSPLIRGTVNAGGTTGDAIIGGTATYNTPLYNVDVEIDTENPAPTPATPGDVANDLAAWLSTTDGTHADSAPLQDHATLATVDTNTAAVKADADDWAFGLGAAAHGYYADLKTLISNIKTITDTLPTPIAQLTSIMLNHYAADIDNILAQIDSVLSNLGAQSTDLSGTSGSAVGALSGRTGFPATGWTMSAEEDFEDAIAFAEAADAYVLTITSYQDTQPANESPAGLWLPRLGWWCVLNGSLASQRQFVDFQQMILGDQGRRMPGCAIQLRPGTLATVQAWLLA
jgi:hypothetical protein